MQDLHYWPIEDITTIEGRHGDRRVDRFRKYHEKPPYRSWWPASIVFNAQQFVYVPYVDLRRALDAGTAGRAAAQKMISSGDFDSLLRCWNAARN